MMLEVLTSHWSHNWFSTINNSSPVGLLLFDVSGGSKMFEVLTLVDAVCSLLSSGGESSIVWPTVGHALREQKDSVDGNFECSNSWNDFVVWLVVVGVWNELAVDFLHGPDLWDLVEDNL